MKLNLPFEIALVINEIGHAMGIEGVQAGQVEEIDQGDVVASQVLLLAQDFIMDLKLAVEVGAVYLVRCLVGH